MKHSKTNRLLSVVMAVLMVVTMFPVTAFAAETGTTYTEVTSEAELATGEYIVVANNGVALTAVDGTWITGTAVEATEGKIVAYDKATVWTLTVGENGVVLTDPNGVSIAPKGGNSNGLSTKSYEWSATFSGGKFVFGGQGEDTVYLAYNSDPQYLKFRGYKIATVNGNPGTYPYEFTLYKAEGGETEDPEVPPVVPEEPAGNTAVYTPEVVDGDKVIIYYAGEGKTMGTEVYTYVNSKGNAKDELTAIDGTLDGDTLTYNEGTAILEASVDSEGNYTFVSQDGKYLYLDGTNVRLVDEASDYTVFSLERAESGYYIAAPKVIAFNKVQYLEYYGGYFTCYGFNESKADIYTFQFFKVEGGETEDPEVPPVVPEEPAGNTAVYTPEVVDGDKVIIYYAGEGKTMGTEVYTYVNSKGNAKDELTAIDGTLDGDTLTYNEGTAILEASVDSEGNYTFVSQDGKYLYLDGTNVRLVDEASDYTVFSLERAESGYYIAAPKAIAFNKVQYLEYYGGYFTCYGFNESKADIYTFQFFKVEGGETEDPEVPPVGPEEPKEGPVKDGDKVVIYNPAHMMALSSNYSGFYNSGIAVTSSNDVLEGYTEAEIWTVGVNEDGTYTFSTAEGKKLSLGASYSSMPLDDVNTDWEISEAKTEGCYYIKNTVRGNYIEWYAEKNNWSSYYNIGNNEDLFAQAFFVIPEEAEDGKITSADRFVSGKYAMVVETGTGMGVLEGTWITAVTPVIEGDKVTDAKGGVWTISVNGNSAIITDANGVSIAPKGGNNNGISSGEYEWSWSFNEENGTFTFKGAGSDTVTLASNPGSEGKFRAYKNKTIESNPSGYPCEFTLYALSESSEETTLPSEGDKVVIYNLSAGGVLGAQNDTNSINNVMAVIWEYETGFTADPENGAVVFTVSKNGNYYRFYNEAYGYLCSNGTGNNAFYSQEASDDADWLIHEGKSGGWNLESRTAKFNGTYSQYLEYYADCYKTYSMYNVTDYDIYEFFFYPLEEGKDVYKDIVHNPEVKITSGDEAAYIGQDWCVEFVFYSAFPMTSEKPAVEFGYQDPETKQIVITYTAEVNGPVNGVYSVVIPEEEIAKAANAKAGEAQTYSLKSAVTDVILVISADFEGEKQASLTQFVTIVDEPSVGEVTPAANVQTGADKRPVISAEINNAGEDATVTMTVNGEPVDAVYDGEKITYTPSEDMEEGRTTVVVKVVRADGKETEKTWNFIVGKAQYQLYFGQLHSHTTYSDGSGSLESALDYILNLPDSANVDFVAFTDHSNYFDGSSAGTTANPEAALYDMSLASEASQKLWNDYKGAIAEFNASQSKVIALGGFEMTWSGGPGHINTFNTEGIVSRNNTTLNNKTNDAGMKAYYALLSQAEGVDSLSQFNHPGSTFGTFTDFAYWDALIDTRIQMVEVGNGEGQIGAGGYYPSYEYYTMALDKGWHVAPTNNQDNHKGKWGNANDARDVILTDNFTEEGIYEAIRAMRMYSTEDKNLEIGYSVNGLLLGSSITEVPEKLNIEVTVFDPDASDSISKVEVIVNSGKVAYTWDDPADLADGALSVELDPTYSYYYIRVTEGDGDLAVTAPVWVGESLKLGISSVETATSTPVTGEELTITTTLFNSESTAATVKSLVYTVNGGKTIGLDVTGYTLPASGSLAVDFAYTPDEAKVMTVTVTAVVVLEGEEYTFTMDLDLDVQDADKLVYIGIDASHYNEYVNGNYKDSMGNFSQLAAGYGVRTVTLYESEDLIAACSNPKYKAIILTAPSRRSAEAQASDPLKVYTEDELAAIKAFNENGGIVILAGWSDHYENYPSVESIKNMKPEEHMAATQNAVLEALGSSLRIGDDATYDDQYNGGQAYRLYFNTYGESFLTEGVEVDPEHPHDRLYTEVFSHYGGASVYTVDGTLPSTVAPIVFGHSGTYSVDVDKDGLGGDSMPKYTSPEGDERLMIMASEQLEGKGLIIVSGAAFMSNFEVQATIEDSGSEKNYSNYKVCENLLAYINPVTVTPIAEVQAQTEVGYKYTIEGVVTSNASGYDKDTAFFDCIYVQDETGGICCFPVAGNYKIGDKVRVTGTTEFYQGEMELQVTSIEVIGEGTVEPKEVSAKEINDRSVEGQLITVKGSVVSFEYANGLVQTIMVKDANGDIVRVFIDGYITTDKDVENLKVGANITVTGLASYDNTFNAPEGPFPRIRVRNRADVICTAGTGSEGGSAGSTHKHEWSGWEDKGAYSERVCPDCGLVERIYTGKTEGEGNPETGAPVNSGSAVSAFAAIAVLSAASFVLGKRK